MSNWYRWFTTLGLVAALTVGVSCTPGDETPAGPSNDQPSMLLLGQPISAVVDLLTCKAQPYVVATKVIGPNGGTLNVGDHTLTIPQGALATPVTIKGEQMSGSVNSVRFSPEGLRFARPAQLTMSYRNCVLTLLPKRIAYTNELLRILDLLPSRDLLLNKTVTAPVDHFSRYAVAF